MKLHRIISSGCVAFVALAGIQFVQAQGVGNLGALPNTFHQEPGGGWSIGNAATSIGVVRDPNGPQWLKKLEGPQGGDFFAAPSQTFSIQEFLHVEGNLPWMDWHEQILTPGWEWDNPIVFFANGLPASGLQIALVPGNSTQGGAVHFDFDPLYAGTSVLIRKQLKYVGGADGTAFFGKVEIAEYPTPEPASLALLSLGSIALLRRRRTIRREANIARAVSL